MSNAPYAALVDKRVSDYQMTLMDKMICEDLEGFLSQLNSEERFVFQSRIGYKAPYLTLQGVGKALFEKIQDKDRTEPFTRERIRQIQAAITKEWSIYTRIKPEDLWVTTKAGYDLLNNDFLPTLYKRLDPKYADKMFSQIIAMTCLSGETALIDEVSMIGVDKTILDNYWVHRAPNDELKAKEQVKDIYQYLKNLDPHVTITMARNAIFRLIQHGVLDYDEARKRIVPRKLNKAIAIAYVCNSFPDGASWKEIQAYVNELGCCSRKLNENRLDFATGSAVDNDWIYQSARGEYAPIANYFNALGRWTTESLVAKIKDILVSEQGYLGSCPLSAVFNRHKDELGISDYFVVRHAIRCHGEEQEVYFAGLSGADMVSLEEDVDMMSKQDAILSHFKDGRQFRVDDVVPLLRSESARHAAFLIDTMIRNGKIIKLDKGTYTCTGQHNVDIDIDSLMQAVTDFLMKNMGEDKSYEELFALVKKRKLNKGLINENHLASIIRANYEDSPGEWEFTINYVKIVNKKKKSKEEKKKAKKPS